jgi:Flp pilus assembly CpaE family ATPase
LLLKLCGNARGDLGGRCYIIGVLNAPEVRQGRGAEEAEGQVAESGALEADQPSVLQSRVRVLEMSSVFADLQDGALRALARRMQTIALAPGDTLRLGGKSGDVVIFLAEGVAEQSITDSAGSKLLLTRRPMPGDLLILPVPRTADRFMTSIRGISDATLLTLDRDGLLAGLGTDAEKVANSLDKLWEQQVAAAAATEAQAATRTSAPIVAFFSAKGGSGVSTLAVNTAAALALRFPRQVLLVDLSAPFGHAALFADLVATGSIAGASKAAPDDFERNLRGAVVYHKTGLGVLPATLRPEQVDLMTAELTGHALDVAGSWHRLVLADLGTSLGEAALVLIERAERLVVVVPPEIAAMTDARRSLAVFRDIMNVPDSKLELVLNQRVPGAPLDRNAIESILGHKMSLTVNFDDTRPEDATLAGNLVLQRDPSSQVSRGANELARLLVGKLKLGG